MLMIIKKNLKEVDFVADKIIMSIVNSADDVNFMLNQIDLNLISSVIERKLIHLRGPAGKTSSYEIQSLVLESLYELGFKKVADSYYDGAFNKTNSK